jgi:glucosyltransferase
METISLIIPCYNEEKTVRPLYDAINNIASQMDNNFEFIFIDDGSKDNTLDIIKKIGITDARIKYISFSRNFGKEAAMLAGLTHAIGDYAAIMDADMQDPPFLLPEMYDYVKAGEYDSVATRRVSREGEPVIRSFFARVFYKIINKLSDIDLADGARDFRLMNRKMIDAILSMKEYNRFSKGIFVWVGFKTKWLPFVNIKRIAGETKWSFWKLLSYSMEGILAFTTAPLAFASIIGVAFCVIAFIFACIIIIKTLLWGDPVDGWPSLACIILFIGGLQLFFMGILGQYLAKTYLETKQRPVYIIKQQKLDDELPN